MRNKDGGKLAKEENRNRDYYGGIETRFADRVRATLNATKGFVPSFPERRTGESTKFEFGDAEIQENFAGNVWPTAYCVSNVSRRTRTWTAEGRCVKTTETP